MAGRAQTSWQCTAAISTQGRRESPDSIWKCSPNIIRLGAWFAPPVLLLGLASGSSAKPAASMKAGVVAVLLAATLGLTAAARVLEPQGASLTAGDTSAGGRPKPSRFATAITPSPSYRPLV